jgi:hypothetical protein
VKPLAPYSSVALVTTEIAQVVLLEKSKVRSLEGGMQDPSNFSKNSRE